MAFKLGNFRFDKATLISLVVVIVLLGAGYGIGTLYGEQNLQNQIIDQGGQQQSLTGTVKSTDKDGFTMDIDKSTSTAGASGSKAPEGTWTVKYGQQGAVINVSSGNSNGKEQLKKGDKVQVSGTPAGKQIVVAQSVTKVLPPTPVPSPAAAAK